MSIATDTRINRQPAERLTADHAIIEACAHPDAAMELDEDEDDDTDPPA